MAVLATAVWRVRPSGSNTNGGGYDPGIAGAATDYSQQNTAQATGSHGTATGTTTFTDAVAANFTSAMVGNALWIASGAGFTTGAYFITAFTSATQVTLDRSPGTGTVAVWALGGGWADPWTNLVSSTTFVVAGNTVYILGSGTPNPASYVYDYTLSAGAFTLAAGNSTAGKILYANDPLTPGYKAPPDTTGGMPTLKIPGSIITNASGTIGFNGLWFVASATGPIFQSSSGEDCTIFGCVYDAFNFASKLKNGGPTLYVIGTEIFSSVAVTNEDFVFSMNGVTVIIGCNIHDIGLGIALSSGSTGILNNNIIAKLTNASGGFGAIFINSVAGASIINNTIDGNGSHGIEIANQADVAVSTVMNNIISNHTGVAKSGIKVDSGGAAANSAIAALVDYNVYYNNTADVTNINYGPHDTHGGSNPYVGQSTENYTLA